MGHYLLTGAFSDTICPGISYPYCIVTYQIKWVTTSWTHSLLSVDTTIASARGDQGHEADPGMQLLSEMEG